MVENQAYLFLVFSLTGIVIGILFDLFRVLRKTFKTSDILTSLEDILFWIFAGIIILYSIWYFNNGEIRLFIFLGIIMGLLIYMLTLSDILIKLLSAIVKMFQKIVMKIIHILSIILRPINNVIKRILKIVYKFYKKIEKNKTFSIKSILKKGNLEKNGE